MSLPYCCQANTEEIQAFTFRLISLQCSGPSLEDKSFERVPSSLGSRFRLRFRGGLVFEAHTLCVSLNSRLGSNKEEEGPYMNRELNSNLSGNKVYYTNSSILLEKNMLCNKLHDQKGFDLIPCSCKTSSTPCSMASKLRRADVPHPRAIKQV